MSDLVFYDGDCGFCHGSVRFLVARDREGDSFRFAPLQGETLRSRLSEDARSGLPDSLLVLTEDGQLLMRSAATVHLLQRLGGGWRVPAALLRAVPVRARDAAYDLFARNRHRLFRRPDASCPVQAPGLRARFDP